MSRSVRERKRYWVAVLAKEPQKKTISPAQLAQQMREEEKRQKKLAKQAAHFQRIHEQKAEAAERKLLKLIKRREMELQRLVDRHNKAKRDAELRETSAQPNTVDIFVHKDSSHVQVRPIIEQDNTVPVVKCNSNFSHNLKLCVKSADIITEATQQCSVVTDVLGNITDKIQNKMNIKKNVCTMSCGIVSIHEIVKGKTCVIIFVITNYILSVGILPLPTATVPTVSILFPLFMGK